MSDADDIRRWSDELARDPGSLVFLKLGEALRRSGQLELAGKIASRGLARHAGNREANELVMRIAEDRSRLAGGVLMAESNPAPVTPPPTLRAQLPEYVAQHLLVDAQGLVMSGSYRDAVGNDVSEDVAAQLSGITDEAVRAARLLDLGPWRAILFETSSSVVGMAPVTDIALTLVTAPRRMPLGMVRRLLARAASRDLAQLEGEQGAGDGHGGIR